MIISFRNTENGVDNMKIAVVGTSWITEKFLSAAVSTGMVTLEAVCSRSHEKGLALAHRFGAKKTYDSLSELVKDSAVESVYIASPNSLHHAQSKLCMENGKNVICEKPAADTAREAEELFALAKEKRVVYTEAIMSMFVPAFDTLKKEISDIGKIRTCNFVYCQLSSKYPAYLRGENPNIFNPAFHTGCLADIGVYNIFLAAGLFGMPDSIISRATFLESGADAEGTAVLAYGGMTVNLIYSKVGQSYSPSEIIGDAGTVSINAVSQLTGIDRITKDGRKNIVAYEIPRDEIMGAEASVFADAVRGDADAVKKIEEVNKISLTVRRISDTIRRQNGFSF